MELDTWMEPEATVHGDGEFRFSTVCIAIGFRLTKIKATYYRGASIHLSWHIWLVLSG